MSMSTGDYWQALSRHDWDHSYSDDPRVYREGIARERDLETMSQISAEHGRMWNAFRNWHRADGPRPEREAA